MTSAGAALLSLVFASAVTLLFLRRERAGRGICAADHQRAADEVRARREERRALEADYTYFRSRLDTLYLMLEEAQADEEKKRARMEQINDLNSYGAVITGKAEEQARRLLYQARQRRLTIEQQIHTAESGRARAAERMTRG